MSSIEDIWDAPLAPSSPRPTQIPIVIDDDDDNDEVPRPSKRPVSSQPLFLVDSDDEQLPARQKNAASDDINTMFQGIDDQEDDDLAFQPLPPAPDVEALRRQASAKHANSSVVPSLTPHAIMSSSPPLSGAEGNDGEKRGKRKDDTGKDGERKERKRIARMDESRLVGSSGFPALIKSTKGFVPKGKGHEAADLNRLLQVYQFWTHKMYPKTQFKDTVDRVEKLCHSKRMHVSLSVWRDEAKGLINGMKPGDPETIDLTSDIEPEKSSPHRPKRPTHNSSSPASDVDVNMVNIPTRPPSSTIETYDDDFDIDALMEEEEGAKWVELNGASAPPSPPPVPPPVPSTVRMQQANLPDEDEDMWDVVRELNSGMSVQLPYIPPSPSTDPIPPTTAVSGNTHGDKSPGVDTGKDAADGNTTTDKGKGRGEERPTNDDDWEDMYL